MRPNRRDQEENLRYHRDRTSGGINALKLAVIVILVGVVVIVALTVTNTHKFDPFSDSTPIPETPTSTSSRFSSSSDDDATGPPTSDSSGSSASSDGSGSSSDSTTSASGSINGSTSSNELGEQLVANDGTSKNETVVAGCTIYGRVTDDWGISMANIRVFATMADGSLVETVTDNRGKYSLPTPTPDVVSLSISLARATGDGNSFAVMQGADIISLSVEIDPESSGCEVNFDSWNVHDHMTASPISVDMWPDAASIYQYTLNAESLAVSMGVDLEKTSTLQVQVWCDDAYFGCDTAPDGAYFIAENELE
ncbi:carboxypeptidase regulatory-like domain-containing protein, partial [Dehalococcoides mccartyi]|nr:carboxypeptidase regulatory-like domain-containing protein [Dehalococcoides mccartyi]